MAWAEIAGEPIIAAYCRQALKIQWILKSLDDPEHPLPLEFCYSSTFWPTPRMLFPGLLSSALLGLYSLTYIDTKLMIHIYIYTYVFHLLHIRTCVGCVYICVRIKSWRIRIRAILRSCRVFRISSRTPSTIPTLQVFIAPSVRDPGVRSEVCAFGLGNVEGQGMYSITLISLV